MQLRAGSQDDVTQARGLQRLQAAVILSVGCMTPPATSGSRVGPRGIRVASESSPSRSRFYGIGSFVRRQQRPHREHASTAVAYCGAMQDRGLQEILFGINYLKHAAGSVRRFVGNFTDTCHGLDGANTRLESNPGSAAESAFISSSI